MRSRTATSGAVASIVMLALGGCAQTTVTPESSTFQIGLPPPRTVLVQRFATNLAEVQENQGLFQKALDASASTSQSDRTDKIAHEVAEVVAGQLVTKINAMGLPAQLVARGAPVPSDAIVVTGHFMDIDEGNRLRRTVIGFGAGQSKIDTEVQVLRPSPGGYNPVLKFTTHADSGAMPGAAVTMGAGAAAQGGMTAGMAAANVAVSGGKVYRSAIDNMATRSADRSAEYLSQFFGSEGWITPDKVQRPLFGG